MNITNNNWQKYTELYLYRECVFIHTQIHNKKIHYICVFNMCIFASPTTNIIASSVNSFIHRD